MFTNPSASTIRVLKITANVSDYNVANELSNPAHPVNVLVIIDSGVIISASNTSTPAFSTGTLTTGSLVRVINNGSIYGAAGVGAQSVQVDYISFALNCQTTYNGSPGGDALYTTANLIIDNTSGNIYGGGGGGGMGEGYSQGGTWNATGVGSAGGGGQGPNNAAGGVRTLGFGCTNFACCSLGNDGAAGSVSAAGAGGAATSCLYSGFYDGGGYGGNGGGWGEAGQDGGPDYNNNKACSAGLGGAAGKAVELNSKSITWLGGNNASQVKGAVS